MFRKMAELPVLIGGRKGQGYLQAIHPVIEGACKVRKSRTSGGRASIYEMSGTNRQVMKVQCKKGDPP
jgi:hypothetical protein